MDFGGPHNSVHDRLYANKLENMDEVDGFLKSCNLQSDSENRKSK